MLSHSATHPFGSEATTKITFFVGFCWFSKYFFLFVLAVYLRKYSSFKKVCLWHLTKMQRRRSRSIVQMLKKIIRFGITHFQPINKRHQRNKDALTWLENVRAHYWRRWMCLARLEICQKIYTTEDFRVKNFTQKTHNFRHLLNRDKKCVNALNWDKTSK